jgi:hypothetical protein
LGGREKGRGNAKQKWEMGEIEVSCLRHKELLDDSLLGKLSNFNSKNRLKTGNSATQGVLQHSFPGSQPHRESSIMPSTRAL